MIDRSPQQRRFLMRCSLAFPIGLGVLLTSCSAMPSDIVARQNARQSLLSADAAANGRGGVMPAYYDAELFTINFKEEPGGARGADHVQRRPHAAAAVLGQRSRRSGGGWRDHAHGD